MFVHRWIFICFLVALSVLKSEFHDENKSKMLCFKKPPKSCICSEKLINKHKTSYEYICSNDVVLEMEYIKKRFSVRCKNVPSFEMFPDLIEYIDTTDIILNNCSVPINRSLYDYTSKISKNIESLYIELTGENDGDKDFNSNYFEGLSNLEYLSLDNLRFRQDFRFPNQNGFTKLFELKSLKLDNFPTPNGIFDSLKQLQHLSIRNEVLNYGSINMELFKNQRKLITLDIWGSAYFYLEPNVFAYLTELRLLYLVFNSFKFLPVNMLKHNHKLYEFKLDENSNSIVSLPQKLFANKWNLRYITLNSNKHEYLPEDLFTNSTRINLIKITDNYISSLPKNIFKDQKDLEVLDLRNNLLKNLTDGLFDSLSFLKALSLSHNKLSSLSK